MQIEPDTEVSFARVAVMCGALSVGSGFIIGWLGIPDPYAAFTMFVLMLIGIACFIWRMR